MILTSIDFPASEKAQLDSLNTLFANWYQAAEGKTFFEGKTAKNILFDGFYPYFSQQKVKVLFISRECLGLSGGHYLDVLHDVYTKNEQLGSHYLNQAQFHDLMFYLTYGLNHQNCPWHDIPMADTIAKTFAKEGGISFAFMNLSKLSNLSEHWSVDWQLVDSFTQAFQDSEINFFHKEIEIIQPDVILTMNLESRLSVLGNVDVLEIDDKATYFQLHCGDRKILLIDLFHFASFHESREATFYQPVVEGMEKYFR